MKMTTEEQLGSLFDNTQLIIILLALITFAAWIAKCYWEKRHFFRKAACIPDPKGVPFYGLIFDLLMSAYEGTFMILTKYMNSTNNSLCKIWFGNKLMVLVSNPEHFEAVLSNKNCLAKDDLYDFTKPYVGEGIFSAPVTKWKKNRKLLNPTFNQKILNDFVPIFSEKSAILMEILDKRTGDPDLDIHDVLSACTVDTICQTALGLNIDGQTTSNHYGKLLDKAMELATLRMMKIIYHPQIIFDMVHGKIFKKTVDELCSLPRKVLEEQKSIFDQKQKSIKDGTYIETDEPKKSTFLKLLLEVSNNEGLLTDQQIQDEVNTIISGGSDTTATCMSFSCLLLAMHPEYQQKVYEEAIEILGVDRDATAEDLPKLLFLDMCLKETLRIFPIVPLIARVAMTDVEIGGYIIPESSTLLLSIFNMHRNPEYWKDPLVYNPYRFSPDKFAKLRPFVYSPFLGGQRNCLGQKYAFMVMKAILTKIIRRFELKTTYKSIQEIELKMNLMIRPVEGFRVTLEDR